MKKNHIKTNTLRTIKKSFPRFLSLIVMSLLGVLVFAGLQATGPDMLKTLDKYLDEGNAYDLKIISSLGLTDDDITALNEIEGIEKVEGVYSKDLLIDKEATEIILNVSSLPEDINTLTLIEGQLPEKDNEIVVEENFLTKNDFQIGDTIKLNNEDIINKEVKIVGTVRSPLYFNNVRVNQNRGVTSVGSGTINYFSYMPKTNFNLDYYTSIYLTVKDAKQEITSKKSYEKLVDKVTEEVNKKKKAQEDNRYNSIYNEALDKITEEEQKANKELAKAKKDLDSAKKKLDNGKKELDKAKKDLATFKSELAKAKKEIDKGNKEFNTQLKNNNIDKNQIDSLIKTVNQNITKLETILKSLNPSSPEFQVYQKELKSLKEKQYLLNILKSTKTKLSQAETEYKKNYDLYQSSNRKYQTSLKTYNSNFKKYEDGLKEYNENKEKAEKEITDAKEELNDIKHPTWYINNRADDQTYSSYIDQTKSIRSLSGVFPVVFFAVAILVSLISMSRMVEDDRGEIGTLKSLGFSNHEIIHKYFLFSLLATLLGGIIGAAIGLTFITYIIFTIYQLLFDLPNFQFSLNIVSTLGGIAIAIICICGATLLTASKILKEKPAMLMRPKAPKSGKKVFLENFKSFWHNIKFSNKITIRNIFRYKKRVLVTIFGIAGCTALTLCGFGIKDSIVDITTMQYEKTFKFDAMVYTNNLDISKVDTIFTSNQITSKTLVEQIAATYEEENVTILATENNESLSKIVNLVDSKNNKVSLEKGKAIITEKLATVKKINIGDSITLLDSDKNPYTFEVSAIAKNYIGHYVYVDRTALEKEKEYKPNIVYLNTIDLTETEQDTLSSNLLKDDSIINVIYIETLMKSTKDMLNSLNKVIVILILLAAMLSFVVLYNLSNINISERKREIATLKVLGFYDNEVDNYITKENIILTILGIILGLGAGYLLTNAVISTVEMANVRFIKEVKLVSYIYASLISGAFTLIVNIVTHFSLKKINMIESLKSVE